MEKLVHNICVTQLDINVCVTPDCADRKDMTTFAVRNVTSLNLSRFPVISH